MQKRSAIVLIGLLAITGVVFADGGVFIRTGASKDADVLQPTQKVYIRWDDSQERLLIQTKYEGPAEEMVWIVPVPSEPAVAKADGAVFNDLSKETYDPAVDYTNFLGLDKFAWTVLGGSTSTSSTDTVEWHKRIGDYDVALLRPTDGNDVTEWLNANDFGVPETIEPALADYVRDGWWMVAARIHPDALSSITSEKLAKGTLHPLEMTFQSTACVFPMRLTCMVGGPVEELIYIEGPAHYEPATLADGSWDIDLFGGPVRQVASDCPLTDLEHAVRILADETTVETRSRLTKLRRVFQPEEMTEDLLFKEIDLASWLSSRKPEQLAQAATQYGRWRDPNGVAPLVDALSSEALARMVPAEDEFRPWPSSSAKFLLWANLMKWSYSPTKEDWASNPGCGPLRSCIWALGEIGVEHEIGQPAEEKLLECARHDNQIIRMEAYIALTKLQSEGLGPILTDRLNDVLGSGELPTQWGFDFQSVEAEMDIAADWIVHFGTATQKDAWVSLLGGLAANIDASKLYDTGCERSAPVTWNWPQWIVWQMANTRDERLISALEELRSRTSLSTVTVGAPDPFLARAKAACGSADAMVTVVRKILDDEAGILQSGQVSDAAGVTSLADLYNTYNGMRSLRVRILQRRGLAYVLHPMPTQAADSIVRSILSRQTTSDWYTLYLLAGIKNPQTEDKNRLVQICTRTDASRGLLAIDVLYVWGDEKTLMDLYDDVESPKIKSEIAWALAALKIPEGGTIIEEQIRDSWNADWLAQGRTFIHPDPDKGGYGDSGLSVEIQRNERALWHYFHPTSGILDEDRLATLKHIASDKTIHAGMRFDLLGSIYGGTEWGLPLLEQAARDILANDSSAVTVQKVVATLETVGDSGFAAKISSN
ncbi:MAG: DUF2330 domain-containing protein [Solirubrobacterales bacterium]